MKEQVEFIATEALGTRKYVPPVWQFFDNELEKFAELIINRCLTQVQGSHLAQGYDRPLTDFEKGYQAGVKACLKNIEKEFDIKY